MSIRLDRLERLAAPGIAGWSIDGPGAGIRFDSDGLEIDGWVLGETAPVVAIETLVSGDRRSLIAVNRDRPDVSMHFPNVAPSTPGFRGWLPIGGRPGRFDAEVRAITSKGDPVPFARLEGTVDTHPAQPVDGETSWAGPNFVIIGAQRSGSTSLFRYLSTHPQVIGSREKEVKYFTAFPDYPWSWYRHQFPDDLPAGAVVGEATPYYLPHPLAPKRVGERLPNAKLVAILRNPIDRALSHYYHERARGTEWLEFPEAVGLEPTRLAGEFDRLVSEPGYTSIAYQNHSYVTRGFYAEQLRRWYQWVSKDQVLVVRSEDLYQEPLATLNRVIAFLGLVPLVAIDAVVHNERPYAPMEPRVRETLASAFRESNHELEELLGRRLGWE